MRKILIIFSLLSLLLAGCGGSVAEKRYKKAKNAKGDILIGVVLEGVNPQEKYLNGMNLAMDQLAATGWVNGRKIKLVFKSDNNSINDGMIVANEFANNEDINFVIGHNISYITIPASSVYEFSGILMITPLSTSTDITDQGYQYIFTMSPDNAQMSDYLADYAFKKKYLNVGLLYSQDDYGQDFANHFERRANELGIEIIDRRGYFGHEGDYQSILAAWKVLYNFDAIFLMDVLPGGAKVVNEIRKAKLTSPIVGSDGLGMGTEELLSIAGKNAEGLVAIVLYNPMDKRPAAIKFAEDYRKKYHSEPNLESAVGYDAIMLLAYAMKQTKSSSATDVAKYLHSLRNWPGAARDYSFAANGSLLLDEKAREKNIGKIIIRDGAVNYLDGDTEVKVNSEK